MKMKKITTATASLSLSLALAGGSMAATLAYSTAVIDDGALVYYQFDETSGTTAVNSGSLGAAKDGTIVSTVTVNQSSFRELGTAYDFGGGHVEIAALSSSLTEWTVEAWINYDSAKNVGSTIFGNDQGGWNDDVLFGIGTETGGLGVPAGSVGVIQQGSPGTTRDFAATVLPGDEWHHVVATGSTIGGRLDLYVDGVLVNSDTSLFNGITLNAFAMAVGAAKTTIDGAYRPFDGLIDEFAIYGTALTQTQITEHFFAAPEPSSTALLGLGGLALMLRRKRS